jgi:pimeloyl-ACP methyl ester carboxylesterase
MSRSQETYNVFSSRGPLPALNWYRALDLDTRIGYVCVPTLYVWGDEDMALGRAAAEATERYVRGPYRFAALPGYSHWLLDEAREQLSNLIVNHLTGLQSQPA